MNELNLCKINFFLGGGEETEAPRGKGCSQSETAGQVPSFSATNCPGWVTSSTPNALTAELFQILLENLDAFYKAFIPL